MKPTTYLIRYKDSKNTPVMNFGPFVSESVADFFKATLPKPVDDGFVEVRPIQPYTAQEGHIVAQVILREREVHQH